MLGSCARDDGKTHIYLQRFFGECGAEYGGSTDIVKAEGECGIITTMIDRFNAENPDIRIDVNVIAWPGYPQLTAQIAAKDPPDLVTMHEGVISDYASKGLLLGLNSTVPKAVQDIYFPGLWNEQLVKGENFQFPWYQGLNV